MVLSIQIVWTKLSLIVQFSMFTHLSNQTALRNLQDIYILQTIVAKNVSM